MKAMVLKVVFGSSLLALIGFMLLAWKVQSDVRPAPARLIASSGKINKAQLLDQSGIPLSFTYANELNMHSILALHEIPIFLQNAFILAEDKRFYSHVGVDWKARLHAAWQNMRSLDTVRGASTISEQVIKLIHSRPRTVWSRLAEGVEAQSLEKNVSKADILEFYLNQVPYARKRRGVLQAAHLYFDRDLNTLNRKEMLALAVLVRAPSRLDPIKDSEKVEKPIERLAKRMLKKRLLNSKEFREILREPLQLREPQPPVEASHFVQHVLTHSKNIELGPFARLRTSLDSQLQRRVQNLLEERIAALQNLKVGDGAVLAVENESGRVLVWVNAGGFSSARGSQYDAVTLLRQPGSTLKPFVYALAMEDGWTPATLITDGPLEQAVGMGLHGYRNYSGRFYGPLRLREALGNSLNSTAVRTVGFVGRTRLLFRLKAAGFESLEQQADFYGDGIALGNAEVTLYELVQAYAVFARGGSILPLSYMMDHSDRIDSKARRVFSLEVSSLVSDILSDPEARRREFGSGGLLHFPTQTAVKTGTSNDYRDAWAMGFTRRYTVGVWMGNLDRTPMMGVSGSIGPATVLRSVFAELERGESTERLPLSPKLVSRNICPVTGRLSGEGCPLLHEWFQAEHVPTETCARHGQTEASAKLVAAQVATPEVVLPTPGLNLAMDPRIPDELEVFAFELQKDSDIRRVEWVLNDQPIGTSTTYAYEWPLARGSHRLRANVWLGEKQEAIATREVHFLVK